MDVKANKPGGDNHACQTAGAKDEFFPADMYMFHVTGFRNSLAC